MKEKEIENIEENENVNSKDNTITNLNPTENETSEQVNVQADTGKDLTNQNASSALEQAEAANLQAEKAIKEQAEAVKLQTADTVDNQVEDATSETANELQTADNVGELEKDNENSNENVNDDSQQDKSSVSEVVEDKAESEDIQDNAEAVLEGEENAEPPLTEEQARIEEARKEAKWYVLHTFSSFENVAKTNLEIVIQKNNLEHRIFDIIIPMEDVVEEKNGKRKVVSRKIMPGYIYVKMIYGDDIWHAVTRTRGITSFAGPKGRPLPLTEEETRRMHLEKVVVIDIDLSENDKVEVLDGPLNGFIGTVLSVDVASKKCRVVVEMFGRETPVDLSLDQVRKIN